MSEQMRQLLLSMYLSWVQDYKEQLSYCIQKKQLSRWGMSTNQLNRAFSSGGENLIEMMGTADLLSKGKTQADPPDFMKMITGLMNQAPQQTQQAPVKGAKATWDGTQWVVNP